MPLPDSRDKIGALIDAPEVCSIAPEPLALNVTDVAPVMVKPCRLIKPFDSVDSLKTSPYELAPKARTPPVGVSMTVTLPAVLEVRLFTNNVDALVDIAFVAPMEPVPESKCSVAVAIEAPPTVSSTVPEPLAESVTSV